MTLLEECLVALGKDVTKLSKEKTDEIFESMLQKFPMTSWGRIDWENVNHKKISSIDEIKKYIKTQEDVYILWDEASLPAIKTELNNVLSVIDSVKAVSFDTWIYSSNWEYVIELYHENEINIGWINAQE